MAFVGAWTGVVLGNWRLDDYYQLDKARVDTVFHGLLYLIPECVQAPLKSIWLYANDSLSFKVFMSLMIGMCSEPRGLTAQGSFHSSFFECLQVRLSRQYSSGPTLLLSNTYVRKRCYVKTPTGLRQTLSLRTEQINLSCVNVLKQFKGLGWLVLMSLISHNGKQSTKRSVLVSFMRLILSDGPRLIIYVGMGALGAWLSVLLIDYFQVKVIEFVSIS